MRGRNATDFGGFFGPLGLVSTAASTEAFAPPVIRQQGIPTMQGYKDRPGKWNMKRAPRLIWDWLRGLRWNPLPAEDIA